MRRGFTLIELAVVVSILGVLVPICYAMHRQNEADVLAAEASIEAAHAARAVSEELRRDLWTHSLAAEGTVLVGAAPCDRIEYAVGDGDVVWRRAPEACGGARAIARNVGALRRDGGEVVVVFRRGIRGEEAKEIPVRIALQGARP